MEEDLDKLIQDHIKTLPAYVREAIQSARPLEALRVISKDFNLHIDQAHALEQETLLVMLGLGDPNEFIREVPKELGLDEKQSKDLLARVQAELFLPIREAMQKYAEELQSKATQQPGTPPSGPTTPPQTPAPTPAPTKEPVQVAPPTPPAPPQPTIPTLSSTPTPLPPQSTPPQKTPLLPQEKTAPSIPSFVDDALTAPSVTPAEKLDVGGVAPQRPPGYKTDPYRELPE